MVLKLVALEPHRLSYSHLALELVMSASEVHASVKRARASRLLHGASLESRPNIGALEEFLNYGLKYSFPAERGEVTRGVATSYGAAPLRTLIAPANDPIPVWPYEEGKQQGILLAPLYKTAPVAALRDQRSMNCWCLLTHCATDVSESATSPRLSYTGAYRADLSPEVSS